MDKDLESGETTENHFTKIKHSIAHFFKVQKNTGSVARDHLANERTFLAWIRTSLALIGFGLLISKFSSDIKSVIGGIIFIVLGLIIFVYSAFRYYFVFFLLRRDYFAANTIGLGIIVLVCLICLICSIVLIMLSQFT